MADLFKLIKEYSSLDKKELIRIAREAFVRFDQSSNRNRNDDFVAHMIGYVAYHADIKMSQQEYNFFRLVTGYTYKDFDAFKSAYARTDMEATYSKLFDYMRNHFSLESKVALLQICLCLCAYDGISSFERSYLQNFFGYETTDAYYDYAEM